MTPFDPIDFRRDLHAHPETGFDLPRTSERVAQVLRDIGLSVSTGIGECGIVATLTPSGTRLGDAIGFRADMDALPIIESNDFPYRSTIAGKFHGCGHDGHTTMLLAAALQLSQSSDLRRPIHFIFQPNEENGLGAQAMVDDGLFTRFPMSAIYGLHNFPGLAIGNFAISSGIFCAFEDNFEIRLSGIGGHSSMPHKGIDPLVLGSSIVMQLQTIVSRFVSPTDSACVSFTQFETDGSRNVIPGSVILRGDCRGFDSSTSSLIHSKMKEMVQGSCSAYGIDYEFDYQTSFVPLINESTATRMASRAAERIGNLDSNYGPVSFSEDFAIFLRHCPGAFILMGNGVEGSHAMPLHNPSYDFNDDAITHGVSYWRSLALDTSDI